MALDPVDEALAAAVSSSPTDAREAHELSIDELAELTGLPTSVIEAIAREGLLRPEPTGSGPRFRHSDVEVLRAGMTLLGTGLPLSELLALARRADEDLRRLADHAVEIFLRFVRDPVRGTATDDDDAADTLVAAVQTMLPAAGRLVESHFQRRVLDAARERVEVERAERTETP